MLRLMTIACAFSGLLLYGGAIACQNLSFNMSIFYGDDDVPAVAPDVEAIAEVTILTEGATDDGLQLGIARVDNVIKGPIGDTIRIVAVVSYCGYPFAVGDRGIVMGNLRTNRRGEIELMARSETRITKRLRREQSHINTRHG